MHRLRCGKRAPANPFFRQQGEPSLDQVQPRGAGRSEVRVEAGMAGQPTLNRWGLVRAVVVQNQMHLQFRGHVGLEGLQKSLDLLGPMAAMALPNDFSGPRPRTATWCHVERSHGCGVPLVRGAWTTGVDGNSTLASATSRRRKTLVACSSHPAE